jgi:hypothetical protein
MAGRKGFAFAGTEQLTVMGGQLHAGSPAPDFRLEYLDLVDAVVCTISLAVSNLSVLASHCFAVALRSLFQFRVIPTQVRKEDTERSISYVNRRQQGRYPSYS